MKKAILAALSLVIAGGLTFGIFSIPQGLAAKTSGPYLLKDGMREDFNAAHCAALTKEIAEAIKNYETNRSQYFAVYSEMRVKINRWLSHLRASGYNTQKLERDLAAWNNRIVSAARSYDQYIKDLRRTQLSQCGNSQGQFMRSLNKARAQQRDFQAKRNEVRRYFNAVIIPDVLALNLQVRDPFPNKQFK